LIKDSAGAEQLRRFIGQFPDSPHRAEAENRIKSLANLAPSPVAPAPPAPVHEAPPPQKRQASKQARPAARKSGNCFAFNGRQVCE
jgi:hypothetical protein